MDLRAYAEFVGFAVVVILVPGPDFAVTVKNTLAGGARRGRATAFGISTSNACQGAASAAGLGALILRSQPLFEAIRWCGVAYLLYLAAQAARSLTHAVLGLVWLLVVVGCVEYARRWLASTRARRVLDGITSLFLAGFAGRLALERT